MSHYRTYRTVSCPVLRCQNVEFKNDSGRNVSNHLVDSSPRYYSSQWFRIMSIPGFQKIGSHLPTPSVEARMWKPWISISKMPYFIIHAFWFHGRVLMKKRVAGREGHGHAVPPGREHGPPVHHLWRHVWHVWGGKKRRRARPRGAGWRLQMRENSPQLVDHTHGEKDIVCFIILFISCRVKRRERF